jgi:hypothetical protein
MVANAIQLAVKYYGDATAFVSILKANQMTDYFINEPVIATTLADAVAGDNTLVLSPIDGIDLEDIVYCTGINTLAVVTSVTQNYQDPTGTPFAYCKVFTDPMRVLPNMGTWLSTTVTISPTLDNDIVTGSNVTFVVGQGQKLILPPQPPASQNGLPS